MGRSTKVFKKRKHYWKKSGFKSLHQTQNVNIGLDSPSTSEGTSQPEAVVGLGLPLVSASSSKLTNQLQCYKEFESSDFIFDIVELNSFMKSVFEVASCKKCGSELQYDVVKRIGLAANVAVKCTRPMCTTKTSCFTSPKPEGHPNPQVRKLFDVNLRLVYALRSIGKGQSSANLFCAVLNLPKPLAKFSRYMEHIVPAVTEVAKESMSEAIEETVRKNDGLRDICVGLDGTWQKRGHVSLNGVVSATSVDTGHVVDIAVMSKHCNCPKNNQQKHEPDCKANYIGTSGGMEVHGAKTIFGRSEELHSVRYVKYLGDGDSKGFDTVSREKVYGDDVTITKLECIGHVQKRMYKRLSTLKSKLAHTTLSDGKGISGRGRLTEEAMKTLQKYYGLAIRRHTNGTLHKMKQAIWASFFHVCSSDESPNHGLCPKGPDSWCKFQKAVAEGENYDHDKHFHLPEAVMNAIKKVYQDLAHPDLLKKCLHGKSQNSNESYNNVLWTRVPKNVFVSLETLSLGAYDAVATFNNGNIAKCLVLKKLGLTVGKESAAALKNLDLVRIQKSEKELLELQKKARQSRTKAKRQLEELYKEKEGPGQPSYEAGFY